MGMRDLVSSKVILYAMASNTFAQETVFISRNPENAKTRYLAYMPIGKF